jgi:hypothetical protein
LRMAKTNRLAASASRLGAKAGPNSAQANTTSEAVKTLRLPTRGTTRPPSWSPMMAPPSRPRSAMANCPSLRPRPSLMAGTREAQVAVTTPVSKK